jgi:hypothetical protein
MAGKAGLALTEAAGLVVEAWKAGRTAGAAGPASGWATGEDGGGRTVAATVTEIIRANARSGDSGAEQKERHGWTCRGFKVEQVEKEVAGGKAVEWARVVAGEKAGAEGTIADIAAGASEAGAMTGDTVGAEAARAADGRTGDIVAGVRGMLHRRNILTAR